MARGAMKTAQASLGHHPGDEGGRPRIVDQERTAVAGGIARAIQCRATRCARAAAHRCQRAAVTPIACHALPCDHAVVGQIARLGFGHAQTGQAAFGIDERALPQAMLVAGTAHDGDCRGAGAEAWRHIAYFRSGCVAAPCGQHQTQPRPRFSSHRRSCTEQSQQADRADCGHVEISAAAGRA